jgi:hypothetical protein
MAETEDNSNRGQAFSTKEMLIRLDGKLDAVLARQQSYEVELALLKARADGLELSEHNRSRTVEKWRDGLKTEAEKRHDELAGEVGSIRSRLEKLGRKHAYQTGALAALVVVANLTLPVVLHFT